MRPWASEYTGAGPVADAVAGVAGSGAADFVSFERVNQNVVPAIASNATAATAMTSPRFDPDGSGGATDSGAGESATNVGGASTGATARVSDEFPVGTAEPVTEARVTEDVAGRSTGSSSARAITSPSPASTAGRSSPAFGLAP